MSSTNHLPPSVCHRCCSDDCTSDQVAHQETARYGTVSLKHGYFFRGPKPFFVGTQVTLSVLKPDALTDGFIQSLSTVKLSMCLELGRLETEALWGMHVRGRHSQCWQYSFAWSSRYMDVHFIIC